MYGQMQFKETHKEDLIDFWRDVAEQTGINIHYKEQLENVFSDGCGGFLLQTDKNSYRVASVLLALGRRGTPRTLDVPGEHLGKVVYGVTDPAMYAGQRVCVVGGGDSALEAAHTIAEQADTTVTLSYRSAAFARAKRKNRDKVEALAAQDRLRVLTCSRVVEITREAVVLEVAGDDGVMREEVANDAVIVCVGGILPTGFLKDIGVAVETKYGTA